MDLFWLSVTSFLICCTSTLLLFPIAEKCGLIDLPNGRKVHTGNVPLIGGISIFISVLVCSVMFLEHSQTFNLYIISSSLILFIGILDDKYDLPVSTRVVAQVIVASLLIFGAELYLQSLGFILYFFEFQLGIFGAIVTIVAVLAAINAFNMIDGIDGLAGMLSLVTFSSITMLLALANSSWYLLSLVFIFALVGYLVFNLRWPLSNIRKVFMGDAGSMLIGLTVIWLLVIGVNESVAAFKPVIALYLVAIPLMDMAAIIYRRLKSGQSPFKPDREHLHHLFEKVGYNRQQTLILITLLSIFIASFGIMGQLYKVAEWKMFIFFILLFLAYSYILKKVSDYYKIQLPK